MCAFVWWPEYQRVWAPSQVTSAVTQGAQVLLPSDPSGTPKRPAVGTRDWAGHSLATSPPWASCLLGEGQARRRHGARSVWWLRAVCVACGTVAPRGGFGRAVRLRCPLRARCVSEGEAPRVRGPGGLGVTLVTFPGHPPQGSSCWRLGLTADHVGDSHCCPDGGSAHRGGARRGWMKPWRAVPEGVLRWEPRPRSWAEITRALSLGSPGPPVPERWRSPLGASGLA